jgi:hypothetical protein
MIHAQQTFDIPIQTHEHRIAWNPPDELIGLLQDRRLKQYDRVELIVAFYAGDHGGCSPSWQEIADVLTLAPRKQRKGHKSAAKVSKGNAYIYGMQLVGRGRARSLDGKFWLTHSQYSHPVIRAKFTHIMIQDA